MSLIAESVARHAHQQPDHPALCSTDRTISYQQLHALLEQTANRLLRGSARIIAIDLDNGPDWAILDLAAQLADKTIIPIPAFFSTAQLRHTLDSAGVEAVICTDPQRYTTESGSPPHRCHWQMGEEAYYWLDLHPDNRPSLPTGTAKITFTSGTTGTPKGVCLSRQGMEQVAHSLASLSEAHAGDRHVCLLPLPTLLENIAGLYVPLLSGACTTLLPLPMVGLSGSSRLDPQRMLSALVEHRATTAITVPALLRGLLGALAAGAPRPETLRYLAVGGAAIATPLLAQAEALGLPVRQGYGLSECASVVAVNGPADNRTGSVGRPLPHVQLSLAGDGEILIRDPGFLGYLGEEATPANPWPSGDLGRLDAEGYLHLTGRKKNIFITAFGRNVSPEWVEAELTAEPALLQAAVFGEGRPWNTALILSATTDAEVDAALARANDRLPDYARIRRWLRVNAPFLPENGQATANGRLRREAIHDAYAQPLESIYAEE